MAKLTVLFISIVKVGFVLCVRGGGGGYHFSQGGVYVTLEARWVSQPRGYNHY